MQKQHLSPYSFADGSFNFLEMNDSKMLVIYIDSWEERTLKLVFSNAHLISFRSGDVISDFCEAKDENIENLCAENLIELIPDEEFKLFQVIEIGGMPMIEVIATDVKITKEQILK